MELPWYSSSLPLSERPEWNPGAVWNHFHSTFFVPVLLIMGVSMVLSFVNLIDPYRRAVKLRVSALANLLFAAMIGFTLSIHWAALSAQLALARSGELSKVARTSASINVSVAFTLGVFAIVALSQAIYEIVKASRLDGEGEPRNGPSTHLATL
jgi:hypothetical protein